MKKEKEKEKKFAYRIIDKVQSKIKEIAKDEKELIALNKKNPDLAKFVGELDRMISDESWKELMRIEAKHQKKK